MEIKTGSKYFIISGFGFFTCGFFIVMIGALLPFVMEGYGLSYNQGGLLLSVQAAGNLAAGIFSGVISAYSGRRFTLVMGSALLTAGFTGFLLSPSVPVLIFTVLISGLGWGTLNNLLNVEAGDAAGGSGRTLNLLHVFFALGALTAPFTAGFCIQLGLDWRFPAAAVVILSLLLTAAFIFTGFGRKTTEHTDGKISFAFFLDPRYFIFMGIFFFYVGIESGINGWLVTYLIKAGIVGGAKAQSTLSVLWICIIVGRMLIIYVSRFFSREGIVLTNSICTAVFVALLLTAKNPIQVFLCIIGLGFSMAGIYPTTIAGTSYLIRSSTLAGGVLFSCGGLGASIVPYLTGWKSQYDGIREGMFVQVALTVILVALTLGNFLLHKSQQRFIDTEDSP